MLGTSQIICAMLLTLWSFNLYVVQKKVVLMGNMVFKTQDMGSVMSYKHQLLWNPCLHTAGVTGSIPVAPTMMEAKQGECRTVLSCTMYRSVQP